jgi:hypothetical protein
VVGDAGTVLKTTDAGAHWTPVTSGTTANLYSIIHPENGLFFAVGSGGTILRSTDPTGATWTQIPIKGRLRTRRRTFPRYMLAMSPQKISGCSEIRKGPGWTPWISKAAKIMAMAGFPGMPRLRRGMKEDS